MRRHVVAAFVFSLCAIVARAQSVRTFYVEDTGPDSLASAITQANAACTDDVPCTIAFRLGTPPPSGYFTLKPSATLPVITAPYLTIDGSTQTQLTGDTNPNGPEVFIDGSATGGNGIVFDSPCSAEVSSLSIGGFPQAAIFVLSTFPRNCATYPGPHFHDNYLGVDPTGTHAAPNGRGVVANDAAFMVVENNIISGNVRSGIWIGKVVSPFIRFNTIGLDRLRQPLGNGASGIYVAPNAIDVDIRGNYIAFNHDFGVAVDRNALGTDIAPNSIFANWQMGIDIGLDGPTPDSGIPAPTVLSAQYDPATDTTVVTVSSREPILVSQPTLTIYAADAPHRSGYGDGQYLLGWFRYDPRRGNTIVFPAKGDWRGKWVSATVTRNDYYGFDIIRAHPDAEFMTTHSTTSEFSRTVKVE